MKIAIVGNGVTRDLAPYDDTEWKVWTTGSVSRVIPRVDVVLEIHAGFDVKDYRKPGAIVIGRRGSGADREIDRDDMFYRFGPYLTGSMSYLMALAIEEKPEAIGLWGVDMAADSEYGAMREHAIYWIGLARGRGINVIVSEGSAILPPRELYALDEPSAAEASLRAHIGELSRKLDKAKQEAIDAKCGAEYMRGAFEVLKYRYFLLTGGSYGD